jgi:hypothetical protein
MLIRRRSACDFLVAKSASASRLALALALQVAGGGQYLASLRLGVKSFLQYSHGSFRPD